MRHPLPAGSWDCALRGLVAIQGAAFSPGAQGGEGISGLHPKDWIQIHGGAGTPKQRGQGPPIPALIASVACSPGPLRRFRSWGVGLGLPSGGWGFLSAAGFGQLWASRGHAPCRSRAASGPVADRGSRSGPSRSVLFCLLGSTKLSIIFKFGFVLPGGVLRLPRGILGFGSWFKLLPPRFGGRLSCPRGFRKG